MQFEKGYIYHIYNQGNNRQNIFFNRENYIFFLKKVETQILPFADIIAYCLMPNHFHLMVLVNEVELAIGTSRASLQAKPSIKTRSLNHSIGIMLRSYTNAINKRNRTTGSLFRKLTKAECINCPKGLTPSFVIKGGITQVNTQDPEQQYPQVCFNYIHQNPVKAKLVREAVDWEFSSARDYHNLRDGNLVNKEVARAYVKF